jgi:hypothetical protein
LTPARARSALAVPAPWILGAALFAAAAALRLSLLHTARFTGDEAQFFGMASDIVEGRSWPLLGTPVTDGQGRLPGPAFLYIITLPLLVTRAPEAQFAFVELLGAASVVLLWQALRRPFGERGAALAGALFALSPWAALYADRTWNPNVLPFFVVLALLCAVRLRERPSSFAPLAILLPTCAVMAHLHLSAPVAWVGVAVLVAPTVREWNLRALALGTAVSAALYLPFLVHELSTSFSNTRHLWAETVGASGPAGPRRASVLHAVLVPLYALRFLTLDVTYHELSGYWGGPGEVGYFKGAVLGTPPRPLHPLRLFALLVSIGLALAAVAEWARLAWRDWSRRVAPPAVSPWSAVLRRAGDALDAAPFACAFLVALAANMALIAATGKAAFGHYVTNLMPFVFVAYAVLGRSVLGGRPIEARGAFATWGNAVGARGTAHPLRRAALLAAALVFVAGGVEATIAISTRVDGRNGLGTHRATLAAIRADGARDGNEREPVRLDMAYRSSISSWQILADRADPTTPRVRFDPNARTRRYRLVEHGAPVPQGSVSFRDVGHAVLHRVE